jgi:hypothetical protein
VKVSFRLLSKLRVNFTAAMCCLVLAGCAHKSGRALGDSTRINKLWAGCENNLRQIDTAKEQWAREKHKSTNDPAPTLDDLREYMGRGTNGIMPQCPCGGTYTVGALDQNATCSLKPEEHTYDRDRLGAGKPSGRR